ncbi:MAG: hypothetical protein E7153_13910 [Enterococcus faecium]|uniref:hypothetical protein n=1 Tax=Enterococcus mundtii TaxID=53346 RepID=UPI0011B26AD6|nr:hypothetical protein [Enterococcus mundtii]MBE6173913.1 hypothetical protein [Enterococcus faecium]
MYHKDKLVTMIESLLYQSSATDQILRRMSSYDIITSFQESRQNQLDRFFTLEVRILVSQ